MQALFLLFSLVLGQEIPHRDYENFNYYTIKMDTASLRLTKRDGVELEKRAYDAAKEANYHFLGRVGELNEYYLVAIQKDRDTDEDIAHTEYKELQVPSKRLVKRSLPPSTPFEVLFGSKAKRTNRNATDFKALGIEDPGFPNQWFLNNLETQDADINVFPVWKRGISGHNVTVAFLDDGLDYKHADLASNYYAKGSYDFNDMDNDPYPKLFDDKHGTRCAGEVAAAPNDQCGVGVAYNSKVAGIRILSGTLTQSDEAKAVHFDSQNNKIYSCSWGPSDDGRAMEKPPPIVHDAFMYGINQGRGGLGSLYVFASGNGGSNGDNCIYTITIGAVDSKNGRPYYVEVCAAQLAVTYSSDNQGKAIVPLQSTNVQYTTDWPNTCTDDHSGSSAAAPIASGIYALVMSIRQDLSWRDFQHLTVRTAVPVSLEDPSWQKVAKGRRFSHYFGFGKLDADKIVTAAMNYTKVAQQVKFDTPKIVVNKEIPNGGHDLDSVFTFTKDMMQNASIGSVEHITVTVTATHDRRGDVEIDLISPHGYVSQLATHRPNDMSRAGFKDWTFSTVKHWDEDPVGNWTLRVRDRVGPETKGTLVNWRMTIYGQDISGQIREPETPVPPIETEPATATMSLLISGIGVMGLIACAFLFYKKHKALEGSYQELNPESGLKREFSQHELGSIKAVEMHSDFDSTEDMA